MSVFAYAAVWAESRAEGNARLVLLALADSASKDTGQTKIGVGTVAEMCRIAPSTVRAQIRKLEEMGELVVVEPGGGRGNWTTWRVNLGRYREITLSDQEELDLKPTGSRRVSEDNPTGNPPKRHRKTTDTPARLEDDTVLYTARRTTQERSELSTIEALACRWCELRSIPCTRPILRRFVGEITEFLKANGNVIPSDRWLRHAADQGIERPAGWAAFAVSNPIKPYIDPERIAEADERYRQRVAEEIAEADERARQAIFADHTLIGSGPDPDKVRAYLDSIVGKLE